MVWGAPEVQYDYKLFGNFGMKLNSKTELYGWSNYSQRKIEGGFYYRNPNTRGGVFDGPEVDNDGTYKTDAEPDVPFVDPDNPTDAEKKRFKTQIKDGLESGRYGYCPDLTGEGCPAVPTNKAADYRKTMKNFPLTASCSTRSSPADSPRSSGERYATGALPVGIRGDISDWHYDLQRRARSTQHGLLHEEHHQSATCHDENRYSDGIQPGQIHGDGSRAQPRSLQVFADRHAPLPLNVGLGLEYRVEQFEVTAGGENSWLVEQ